MSTFLLSFMSVFLFGPLVLSSEPVIATKPVTFLIYYSGDNNLSHFMKASLNRVLAEGVNDRVHVVVQYDGNQNNDSLRLSVNQQGSVSMAHIWEQNLEYDMGQSQTLIDFVEWGKSKFPSEKLVLLVFAHGRGVLNVPVNDGSSFQESKDILSLASSSDDTSQSYMNEEVLVRGLKKVLGSQMIDLLIYNSCLMGNLEVMSMFSEVASAAMASEYPIYVTLKDGDDKVGRAISVENILKDIKNSVEFQPREIAKNAIQNFEQTYQDFIFPGGDPDQLVAQTFPSTLAFYDLKKIRDLSLAFTQSLHDFQEAVKTDNQVLHRFFAENLRSDYVDSLGYIDVLIFYRSLMRSLYPTGSDLKIKSFEKIHAQVVTEKVALHVDHPDQLGHLSFFFPSIKKESSFVQRFQAYYDKIEVPKKWGWSQFLNFFWKQNLSQSDQFWLSQLQKWSNGETVFSTANPSIENADYYFFIDLDVQAIKWRKNPEWFSRYRDHLRSIKRSSPYLDSHLRYVERLSIN